MPTVNRAPILTGPATQDISQPLSGNIKTLSYGPPFDRPTHDTQYGALTDSQGNQVRLNTQDVAMSPNLYKQYGLKLGQNVDLIDPDTGNVIYANQRLADKSYYSPGKPTTNTVELWGRPDVGNVAIRPSALQGPSPQPVGPAVQMMSDAGDGSQQSLSDAIRQAQIADSLQQQPDFDPDPDTLYT